MSAFYAMTKYKLPKDIRWMRGGFIQTEDGGRKVTHGILINNRRSSREPTCSKGVACAEREEVEAAMQDAIAMLRDEVRRKTAQ